MRDERESLRRRIEEAREHLLLMEEQKSKYVEETSISLQLIREEKVKKEELSRLERELFRLSADQPAVRAALREEDKEQIMLALIKSGRLEDPAACRAVVGSLTFANGVDCDAILHARTMGLLEACLKYPDGLEELVEVLASSYGDEGAASGGLRPLHQALQRHLTQPVGWGWVTEAKALLKTLDVGREELEACYLASCPEGVRLPPAVTTRGGALFPMLDSLAKMSCRAPDAAPYLEFLLRLLPRAGGVAERLTAYSARLATDLGFELKAIGEKVARAETAPAPEMVTSVYLTVKVEPSAWQPASPEDPRRLLINAWAEYAGSFEPLPEAEGEHTFDDLPSLMERFITECHLHVLARSKGRLGTEYSLTVELFLPVELLDCGADQWEIKVGGRTRRPIGARYQVVVRSWDRVYWPECRGTWDLWRGKWHRRPRPPLRATEQSHIFIASCDDDYCQSLYDHLVERGTVFMALSPLPPARRRGGAAEVIWPLIDAGTPIALWLRREDEDVPATRDELRQLVCGEDLNALPHLVHDRRREAQTVAQRRRLWNHLSLLWDDPERLPPDVFGRLEKPKEQVTDP